jgi:hypothetical protein
VERHRAANLPQDTIAERHLSRRDPSWWLPARLYDMDNHYQTIKDKFIGFAGGPGNYQPF